jgi:hypothetical protein
LLPAGEMTGRDCTMPSTVTGLDAAWYVMEQGDSGGDSHGDRAHTPHVQKNRAVQNTKGGRHLIRLEMTRQTRAAARAEYGSRKPV